MPPSSQHRIGNNANSPLVLKLWPHDRCREGACELVRVGKEGGLAPELDTRAFTNSRYRETPRGVPDSKPGGRSERRSSETLGVVESREIVRLNSAYHDLASREGLAGRARRARSSTRPSNVYHCTRHRRSETGTRHKVHVKYHERNRVRLTSSSSFVSLRR